MAQTLFAESTKGFTNPAHALNDSDTWRAFFEASIDAVVLMDETGFIDCNRVGMEWMGFTRKEQLKALRPEDLSPPLQPDGRRSDEKIYEMLRIAKEKGSHRFHWLHRRPVDGIESYTEISITCITLPSGKTLFQAVNRDITGWRRMEEESSENALRLQRVIENLPTGAVCFEGDRVYLNRAAEEVLGYSRVELGTKDDWFRNLYGVQAELIRPLYEMEREAGFPMPVKVPIHRKDGKRRVIEFAGHRDRETDTDIVVLTDITDQARLSEAEWHEQHILELITSGKPLDEVLSKIAHIGELYIPGSACVIYSLDDSGDHLVLAPSESLPESFQQQTASLSLNDASSMPGIVAAFHCATPLITANIEEYPDWEGGDIPVTAGYRTCWAQSVRIASGIPVGVVAFFLPEVSEPGTAEMHLLKMASHIIGLAIQRRRSDEELRRVNVELEARVFERTAELRRANRELEAERARLEAVLQRMPAGIAIIEIGTGRPLMMNDQVAHIWRLAPEDLKKSEDLFDVVLEKPDGTPYSKEDLPLRVFQTGESVDDLEFAIRRCDGTRGVVLSSVAPIYNSDGKPYAMVTSIKDITDLKNTEEALRRLHDELELQVQERTAELARANQSLRGEIGLRERAEQLSRGQSEALIRTLDALTRQINPNEMLENVLFAISQQIRAESLVFWLYDAATNTNQVRHVYAEGVKMDKDCLEKMGVLTTIPAEDMFAWHKMCETRRPVVIYNPGEEICTQNRSIMKDKGIKSVLAVPLFLADEPIGCFSILTRQEHEYHEEEIELAQALAHQVALAVQMERLSTQGREGAILEERNRMAREIHDTLAQGFTSIIIHLQLAEAAMARKPEKALPTLLKARDIAKDSLAEARRSVWALRPNALEGSNLANGLRRLVDSMAIGEGAGYAGANVKPRVEVSGIPRSLPNETEDHLLRIGQEALNNAFKYAEATEISLRVHFEAEQLTLTVRDNGCGFSSDNKPQGSGFGHTGMRERITVLRGELTIESAPGAGTSIVAVVPI